MLFRSLVVAIVGVPALMAELALGRATRQGPLSAYATAGIGAGKMVGVLLFIGVGMAMSYYLVVIGWILAYVGIAVANVVGATDNFSSATFGWLQTNWPPLVLCAAIVAPASDPKIVA